MALDHVLHVDDVDLVRLLELALPLLESTAARITAKVTDLEHMVDGLHGEIGLLRTTALGLLLRLLRLVLLLRSTLAPVRVRTASRFLKLLLEQCDLLLVDGGSASPFLEPREAGLDGRRDSRRLLHVGLTRARRLVRDLVPPGVECP